MKGSLCRLAETSFLWRDTAMRIRERFNPHAPFEARRGGRLAPASNDRFNPRAPCGARRNWARRSPRYGISTHAPLAGRDILSVRRLEVRQDFNPRAPCGARLPRTGRSVFNSYFNPRAPCGARLAKGKFDMSEFLFQPTRPLRGATGAAQRQDFPRQISTHAPLAGRDRTAARRLYA